MTAVDTNVLLYVHDPRDPLKQRLAHSLIQSIPDGVLLWQVACEYLAASSKLAPFGYSRSQAWDDIQELARLWSTALPNWQVLDGAKALLARFSLSFWDAVILAACLDAGIARLYTEDFDAYARVEEVEIHQSFRRCRLSTTGKGWSDRLNRLEA